ncbi:unnamed protein product [Amoebophrya sp. A120]|nr:unnamed protein product [Amoebophrya sp. A120]|eukprot:GSA120T00000583001.1
MSRSRSRSPPAARRSRSRSGGAGAAAPAARSGSEEKEPRSHNSKERSEPAPARGRSRSAARRNGPPSSSPRGGAREDDEKEQATKKNIKSSPGKVIYNKSSRYHESEDRRHLGTTLWIGNLPNTVTETQAREVLEKYGKLVDVRLKNSDTSKGPPFGFVEFHEKRDAEDALAALDGSTKIWPDHDEKISCQVSKPKGKGKGKDDYDRYGGKSAYDRDPRDYYRPRDDHYRRDRDEGPYSRRDDCSRREREDRYKGGSSYGKDRWREDRSPYGKGKGRRDSRDRRGRRDSYGGGKGPSRREASRGRGYNYPSKGGSYHDSWDHKGKRGDSRDRKGGSSFGKDGPPSKSGGKGFGGYTAPSFFRGKENYKISLTNLPLDMSWIELKTLGQRDGKEPTFARTFVNRDGINCGVLEYQKKDEAEDIVKEMDNRKIKGHEGRLTCEMGDKWRR